MKKEDNKISVNSGYYDLLKDNPFFVKLLSPNWLGPAEEVDKLNRKFSGWPHELKYAPAGVEDAYYVASYLQGAWLHHAYELSKVHLSMLQTLAMTNQDLSHLPEANQIFAAYMRLKEGGTYAID